MSRTQLRKYIFLLLFRAEFIPGDEMPEQISWFFEESEDISEEDREYITEKLEKILACLPQLDETIEEICQGWKLNRLGKIELAVLRLGVYEINMDEDIPKGVAINEAVELAKRYSSDKAARFVNGVLAKLA